MIQVIIMINDVIKERLFELRDIEYGEFQKKLIPTVNPDTVIGVRLPEIKKAREGAL